MDNFMDEDDEEILTDNDLIEIDENDLVYDSQASSSEELNHMDANSEAGETEEHFEMAPEHVKLVQSFSLNQHANKLLSNNGLGDLATLMYDHWKVYVPICFNALDTPKKNMIETDSEKILLKPLEIYLANTLDSEKFFEHLKEIEDPPTVCGRVFKSGEPSYFCRDCGFDPTCVLCSLCFRNSKHRYHKYIMMTSGGGGYCDCGDPEAWKSDPCCDLHMPKSTNQPIDEDTPQDYHQKLPNDLVQRAKQLFTYLLEFIFEILSTNKEDLPESLRTNNVEDDYVTMLYNDEVHSYEQVVNTLKKVVGADDRKAFDYASIVDKEGRSAIKRSKKALCDQIKQNIEKTMSGPNSRPLDTKVFHHSVVAHQYFAEKILVWVQKICGYSKGLKNILCEVGTFIDSNNQNIIEKLMINDNIYWKSARTILHQFYISMFFMDSYWKKKFSILFIKNYKIIWNSHVKNQDDTVSLTDLTVQIFTVPSLSKYLIEKYGIIQTIMDSIIEHSTTNQQGKLSFPRNRYRSGSEFKRAQSMLFDLKYCLTSAPKIWTEDLRKSFLNGFKSFINFMRKMHGMDVLKRYIQQHIEYEPEWETSFNLVIRLQKSISNLIEWSSSDQDVYEKSMEYLLSVLQEVESNEPFFNYRYNTVVFNDTTYEYIDFQVIREEVSIHAPLSRILAAIYSRMGRYNLNFETLSQKLKPNMPVPKALNLIEPSLRALILVAQTNAGFWKRNGFSLLSQVYFYSNIKCRHEMFDRDIQCLQMGASLMNPNEFLINLLHHYGIYDYLTNENFELTKGDKLTDDQKADYLISMGQEFLELLIYIISERFNPNMSQIEANKSLEREVIHQLSISLMAHSDLVKNIFPDNEKFTNELENVLSRIANFKSSINSKGVYELKEEYQAYYSPYFYHYSRSEKSKSEEHQLSKKKSESERFFKPPRLPPLTELYSNINHLLDCDVFIQIVFVLIKRQINQSKLCSYGQILRILHLIGLALYEEQDDVDKNIQSLESNPTYLFKFLEKSVLNKKKSNIFSIKSFKTEENLVKLLDDLISIPNNENFKQMTIWINEYSLKLLKLKHKIDQQKNQQSTEGTSKLDEEKELKEKRKNEIAEKRRAKILAQLNLQSKKFIESHKSFYEETKVGSVASEIKKPDNSMEIDQVMEKVVCIGPERNTNISTSTKISRCILCQEEEEINLKNSTMVICCYVQMSKVLSKNRMENIDDFEHFDSLFMKNSLTWGIASTSCGHMMHASCWQKYVDTMRQIESRRNARYLSFDFKRNEYICPLCETIGNTVLPIYPDLNSLTQPTLQADAKSIEITFEDWIDGLEKTLENSVKKELHEDKDVFIINPCPLSTITKLMRDAVASNFRLLFESEYAQSLLPSVATIAEQSEPKFNSETINIIENFTRASYTFGYNTLPNDEDSRMPISIWTNCAFTIQFTEQLLRFESKPLFGRLTFKQTDLVSNLVKQAAIYGITKNTESVRKNCLRLLATCMPYKTAFFELKNLMELDMFHMLVYLCLSMPNLYNDSPDLISVVYGGINDLNIFKLILIAHSVQILLTKISNRKFYQSSKESQPDIKHNKIYDFYKFISNFCFDQNIVKQTNTESRELQSSPSEIYATLKYSLMPFLKCSALFFSNLTNTSPLLSIENNDVDLDKNFDAIMTFLGIKEDLGEILDIKSPSIKILVESWLNTEAKAQPRKGIKIDYPIQLNRFIELPNDFVDLMSLSTSNNVCTTRQSSIMDRSAESANIICLVCGELLCSQMYCCQKDLFKKRVGNCTAHAFSCGGKTGVFLRVSECQVLLLNLNYSDSSDLEVKGCFLPAPYLDDYGETDQGLRRGNPLKLCKVRYDKLYKDWLSHAIPEVISRQYQMQTSMVTANWSEF